MVERENTIASQLQKLWRIESMLVEAMPRMIDKTNNFGLRKALALHFAETDQQKTAIEAICKQLDIDPRAAEPDSGLLNILQQGEKEMVDLTSGRERDAIIIASAQKIEAYEISVYEPIANEVERLGYKGVAQRLRLTLEEERQSETKLKFLEKAMFSERAEIGQQDAVSMSPR
jgi:ferritin-like metal-binding protein YciE